MLKIKKVYKEQEIIPAHFVEKEQLFCDKCGKELQTILQSFFLTILMFFDYVKGCNMELTIQDNLVYVERYNVANGIWLAQRVIRTIPNKDLDIQKLKKDKK